MTDNEIIKELRASSEWFTEHGRNTNTAIVGICDRAIELINRQKAEIERLTINMNAFGLGMKREKERADNARAEAVKEFAERLKEKAKGCFYDLGNLDDFNCAMTELDNFVKEFTEGE